VKILKKKVSKIVKELSELIKIRFPDYKGLYVYGSQVKGDSHKDSDIDIVALFDTTCWQKTYELSEIICDLIYKYDIYIDVHPYTIQDLEKNPVYHNEVVNKGIFYGKS